MVLHFFDVSLAASGLIKMSGPRMLFFSHLSNYLIHNLIHYIFSHLCSCIKLPENMQSGPSTSVKAQLAASVPLVRSSLIHGKVQLLIFFWRVLAYNGINFLYIFFKKHQQFRTSTSRLTNAMLYLCIFAFQKVLLLRLNVTIMHYLEQVI